MISHSTQKVDDTFMNLIKEKDHPVFEDGIEEINKLADVMKKIEIIFGIKQTLDLATLCREITKKGYSGKIQSIDHYI